MRVRFLTIASVQGRGYRPGQTADLPDAVAKAYIRVGQAEQIIVEPELSDPSDVSDQSEAPEPAPPPKPKRGRKPTARRGKNVETAADEDRETR